MPKLGLFSSGWAAGSVVQFGGSDFWRLAVPARELAKHGWDIVPGREVQQRRDGELVLRDESGVLHDGFDVVLWQRYMGAGGAEILRRARAVGQAIINDVDDYFWALPRGHIAHLGTDPRRNADYNRDHYRATLKASTLVTVSTQWLANALGRWGPPMRVVRNYIALDLWPTRPPGQHVGWIGVIPWRGADLEILSSTVIPWLRERKRPFYHGGDMPDARPAREILGYEQMITRAAQPIPNYPSLWNPLRVALAPIETSSFGLAKSWCKGLEGCARGIPVIASDHPEYRALRAPGVFLAKRPADWVRHLEALEDPAVFAPLCAANRARAEELSIAKNWQAWDEVLREAIRLESTGGGARDQHVQQAELSPVHA